MKYNPKKYHRCSIRLKGYDYTQPWGVFRHAGDRRPRLSIWRNRSGRVADKPNWEHRREMLAGYPDPFFWNILGQICDYAQPSSWDYPPPGLYGRSIRSPGAKGLSWRRKTRAGISSSELGGCFAPTMSGRKYLLHEREAKA